MSIGNYIVVALVALFMIAIAFGGEEGLALWFFIATLTGVGYSIGKSFYTAGKARIFTLVEEPSGSAGSRSAVSKADVTVLLDGEVFKRGFTNSEGKCMFYLPIGRTYEFEARKGDYETSKESLNVSDKSMRGMSLVVSARRVTVHVTDERNTPVRDAVVNARGSTFTQTEHTDGDGTCIFKQLPFEPGDLIVEKEGYAPGKVSLGEFNTLISLQLVPKFVTTRIEVVDELEQPIEGASVKIGKKSHVTNEWGVVEAETRVGIQKITVEKEDLVPVTISLDISDDIDQRVLLKEPHGRLEVSVVDAVSGEHLPASVTLLLFGSKSVKGESEGGEDKVRFENVPVGTHQLRSTMDGYHQKEMAIKIIEGTNTLELLFEPLPALSDALVNELMSVEEGIGVTVNSLAQNFDAVLPRYFQSYCLTLLQLVRRLPQGVDLPPELMVDVIRAVCRDVTRIMEEKKLFGPPTQAGEELVEFPSRADEFYDMFKDLINDPNAFYERHSSYVQQQITDVDRKITEKMVEYEISPVTSFWRLAKKLAATRGDVAKNAITLFCAEIALDFNERMFVVKEVADRLRKR